MTKTNRSSPSPRGFTLLEVLIAVLIVGIIATALMPLLGSYTEKAREAREEANMVVKAQAIDRYVADHKVGLGMVYDPSDDTITTYGLDTMQGPTAQLLLNTDVNGNVLGDPVAASPGPFSYGPYLAELPPEAASLLLGGRTEPIRSITALTPLSRGALFLTLGPGQHDVRYAWRNTQEPPATGRLLRGPLQIDQAELHTVTIESGATAVGALGKVLRDIATAAPPAVGQKVFAKITQASDLIFELEKRRTDLKTELTGFERAQRLGAQVVVAGFGSIYEEGARIKQMHADITFAANRLNAADATKMLPSVLETYTRYRHAEYLNAMPRDAWAPTTDLRSEERELRTALRDNGQKSFEDLLLDAETQLNGYSSGLGQTARSHALGSAALGWSPLEQPSAEVRRMFAYLGGSTVDIEGTLETTDRKAGLRQRIDWGVVGPSIHDAIANEYKKRIPSFDGSWQTSLARRGADLGLVSSEHEQRVQDLLVLRMPIVLIFPLEVHAPDGTVPAPARDHYFAGRIGVFWNRWRRGGCHWVCPLILLDGLANDAA